MEIVVTGASPDVLDDSFTVSTNEDWIRNYQLKSDGISGPIAADWKLFMQLQSVSSGDLAATMSSDNRRIAIVDRDAGIFGLRLKQVDASQIIPGAYAYDIVLVAGDGIYRLVRGTITVEQGITNVPGQEKWSHFPLILRP